MKNRSKIKKIKVENLTFDVVLADNFIKRALGLMFRDIGNKAMLFLYRKRKVSIHTFFMSYPIDVLFIDRDEIVDAITLKPWKTYKCRCYTTAMLEFKSRDIDVKKLIGKKVVFISD